MLSSLDDDLNSSGLMHAILLRTVISLTFFRTHPHLIMLLSKGRLNSIDLNFFNTLIRFRDPICSRLSLFLVGSRSIAIYSFSFTLWVVIQRLHFVLDLVKDNSFKQKETITVTVRIISGLYVEGCTKLNQSGLTRKDLAWKAGESRTEISTSCDHVKHSELCRTVSELSMSRVEEFWFEWR